MSADRFVDWGLAERVAVALGGNDGPPGAFDQEALDTACAEATALALDYSQLCPSEELPRPELVDRAEWARLGLRTLRELSVELERQVADGLSLPGPLGGLARSAGGRRGRGRGRDRGRLRSPQGARPVRRLAGAGGEAAAAGVRGREPRRRTPRARRGPRPLPALDRHPREHPLDPVRLGPLAPGASGRARRAADRRRFVATRPGLASRAGQAAVPQRSPRGGSHDPARRPRPPARGARAEAHSRPPSGVDVRDRGARRARHGRRRRASSIPAMRASASASRLGGTAAAGWAR